MQILYYFGSQELTFAELSDEISTFGNLIYCMQIHPYVFSIPEQIEQVHSVGTVSYDSSLEQYARGLIESSFDDASAFLGSSRIIVLSIKVFKSKA